MDAPEQQSEPEQPSEPAAPRLGRAAEERGLAAARWVGRGDAARGISLLALGAAAGSFVCLFMPWIGLGGHTQSGWNLPLPDDYGLVSLAVVLVELLALARVWITRGSELVAFCLAAGAGVLGVSTVFNLPWGGYFVAGFSELEYGAWLGLVFSIVLLVVAALRISALWRSAP